MAATNDAQKPDSTGELEQEIKRLLRHHNEVVVGAHNFGASYVPDGINDETRAAILALIRQRDAEQRERLLEAVGEDLIPMDNSYNIIITKYKRELRQAIKSIYGGENVT